MAIKFIKKPYNCTKLEAIKQNGYAIQYIENQTDEMKFLAIDEGGPGVLYYIRGEITDDIIYRALNSPKYKNIEQLKNVLSDIYIDWHKISNETKLLLEIKEF